MKHSPHLMRRLLQPDIAIEINLRYHSTMTADLTITSQTPATMGRPRKEFSEEDWNTVDKLCNLLCTASEIADFMDVSVDTLYRRIQERHGCTFAEHLSKCAAHAKVALRRAQWKSAVEHNNVAMQIWLGKQILGQRNNSNVSIQTYDPNKDIRNAWKYMEEYARDNSDLQVI
jgi:hypothetical protein